MSNRFLFSVTVTALVISSALFAGYCKERRAENEAVQVMSYGVAGKQGAGITFSDLAERVEALVNGEVRH